MAFGLDERTVLSWQSRSGKHCQEVHEHLVEQPRDLGQVQADEIRVKMQGLIVWMAMAIQVRTRLWLGGVVSQSRDKHLMRALMQRVRRCALCRSLLFYVDGCRAYIDAIRKTFREPIPGQTGRPRLRAWDGIIIAQVVKQYAHGRVVGVTRRIVQGAEAQIKALLRTTQGVGVINAAYIERLNATFRSRIAALLLRRGPNATIYRSEESIEGPRFPVQVPACEYPDGWLVVLVLAHARVPSMQDEAILPQY